MTDRSRRPTVFLVGAGRLATAIALGLRAAGWSVAAHARSARGRAALRRLGVPSRPLADAGRHDLVLLAVPDAAVPVAALAVAPHLRRGQVVAHGAGALDLSPLEPVRARGAHPGSLHPVQALAGGPLRPGTIAAVDGDAAARRLLTRLARALRLAPIAVPPEGRARYHASAVIAANLAMALFDLAEETWARSGAPPGVAHRALVPLMRGAVENLARRGLPAALTGPASRGDAEVVARQLSVLEGDAREVYRLLSRRIARRARRTLIDDAKARRVLRALATPTAPPAGTARAPRGTRGRAPARAR